MNRLTRASPTFAASPIDCFRCHFPLYQSSPDHRFAPIEDFSMTATYQVIGTRPIRHDGIDKVTGRALYGADFQAAGLLHGRILRSPHAHAKIKKIDTSKALALPGVEAVITSADFPNPGNRIADLGEGAINLAHLSSNCLARGKVLYKGHAVAAVAAVNAHVAE